MPRESTIGNPLAWMSGVTGLSIPEGEPLQPISPDQQIIGRLGTFQVLEVVSGGMGEIFLCIKENDPGRRLLALKSLKREFQFNRSIRRAFERECIIWGAASLAPGVFPVYGIEYIEGRPFIVMPGIPGGRERSLQDLLDNRTLSLGETIFVARTIADTLSRNIGLVHGDLTPANVLIWNGTPLISDFGLTHILPLAHLDPLGGQPRGGDRLAATRAYSSPHLRRNPQTPPTVVDDVYSFGVILEQMLTGQLPGRTQKVVMPISDAATPIYNNLLALAQRCHAEDPSSRPSDFISIVRKLNQLAPEADWPAAPGWARPARADRQSVARRLLGVVTMLVTLGAYPLAEAVIRRYELSLNLIARIRGIRDWRLWLIRGHALTAHGDPRNLRRAIRCFSIASRRRLGDGREKLVCDTQMITIFTSGAYLKGGRPRMAERKLRYLLEHPADETIRSTAINALAVVYIETERYREAEQLLQKDQTATDDPVHWNNLGALYLRLKELEQAAQAYERALELDPWDSQLYSGLGQALMQIPERAPQAMAAFDRAIECGASQPDDFHFALTCAYIVGNILDIWHIQQLMRQMFGWGGTAAMAESAKETAHSITGDSSHMDWGDVVVTYEELLSIQPYLLPPDKDQ